MKILDPNLKDGVHEWRDGKRFVKEGDRLYLEGTDTLAGRYASHLARSNFELNFSSALSPWTSVSATSSASLAARSATQSSVRLITLRSTLFSSVLSP